MSESCTNAGSQPNTQQTNLTDDQPESPNASTKVKKRIYGDITPSPSKVKTTAKKSSAIPKNTDKKTSAVASKKGRKSKTDNPVKRLGPTKATKPSTMLIADITTNLLQNQISTMAKKIDNLSMEVSALKKTIETINETKRDPVSNIDQDYPSLFSSRLDPNKSSPPTLTEAKLMCRLTAHNHDRENRVKYIVIMGAPEAHCIDIGTEAIDYVNKLFSHLKLQPSNIINCKRLRANGDYPGIIKVKLANKSARDEALRATKLLRSSERYKKVFINADLTREERMVEKIMLKDMKQYNECRTEEEKKIFHYGI